MPRLLIATVVVMLIVLAQQGTCWRSRRRREPPPPCPVRFCQVSYWSSWTHCSQVCGNGGVKSRTRTKTVQESCGGTCYFDLSQETSCNRYCQNGGTPAYGYCYCRKKFTGKCCEHEKPKYYKDEEKPKKDKDKEKPKQDKDKEKPKQDKDKEKPKQDKDKGMSSDVKVIVGLILSAVGIVLPVLIGVCYAKRNQASDGKTYPGSTRPAHCCNCDRCSPRCSQPTYNGQGNNNAVGNTNAAWGNDTQQNQVHQQIQLFKCLNCSS